MKISKFVMVLLALSSFATISFAQTKVADTDIKKNVTPVSGALNAINRLEPVTYQYDVQSFKGVKMPGGTQYGFMTGNMQSVFPGMIKTESKLYPAGKNAVRSVDVQSVDMQSLIPVLLGAIKEQQLQIDALKSELQSLKGNAGTTSAAR